MAEEGTTAKPTNGESAAASTKENGGKPNRKQKEQKPIEELYDLSKPIPRVEKPNKSELDAKVNDYTAQFEKLKADKNKIQAKIDAAMGGGKNTEIGKAKDSMQSLKSKKNKLIEEKRSIRAKLDALKSQGDKLQKDKKDAKSSVRFTSVDEIDKEIARLQRKQETTSMSLNEEKKLIKEMDALKASKEKIKDLQDKEVGLADVKQQRTIITDMIKAKDKEIDAVSKQMDDIGANIKKLAEKETDKKSSLDGLFKERDKLRKDISNVLKEKDTIRDEFRKKNDAWYDYQRAVKAQKKIQYEEERKKREEEKQAYLKKLEEEELKKIPYEEEQGLCDYLADYLERTYLNGGGDENDKVAAKKEDVVEVKDDPFAGFKPVNKKNEEEYFGKGKSKKKRQRAPKKTEAAGPFTLNVDSFEQFGLIGLNPPTSLDQVEKSVKELREKKEWYKQQPRGSVPTAKDIRKQNEKNAAKLRQGSTASGNSAGGKGGGGTGKFSLSSDDFVPLGKGASAPTDSSSWGQKTAADAAEGES